MTEVITWVIDCGDGVCIEREQPSTAVNPMPAYGALNSSLTVNGAVHDPLTGLDTGSGNDRITTGLGEDNFTTGAGGDSFNCDDILLGHGAIGYEMQVGMGISANARGKTTGTIAALQIDTGSGNDRNVLRSDNRFVIEPVNLFQGLDAGGMNYAEPVGLDSSTVDVMNNVISNLQPANEFI